MSNKNLYTSEIVKMLNAVELELYRIANSGLNHSAKNSAIRDVCSDLRRLETTIIQSPDVLDDTNQLPF